MQGKTTIKYLQNYLIENVTENFDLNWLFLKLIEEVGELSVAMRKNLLRDTSGTIKSTIDEELWDIMFYTLVIANQYNVDMEKTIKDKEVLNFVKWNNPIPFEEIDNIKNDLQVLDGKTTVKYLQNYLLANNNHPEKLDRFFLKLIEEVGELSVAIRKNLVRKEGDNVKGTIDEELWDIIYYVLIIANCYEIDMEEVIKLKEEVNFVKWNHPTAFEENR